MNLKKKAKTLLKMAFLIKITNFAPKMPFFNMVPFFMKILKCVIKIKKVKYVIKSPYIEIQMVHR